MLSTKKFAELHGVHYLTALRWLRSGLVRGAEQHHYPGAEKGKEKFSTYWSIPIDAAKAFVPPSLRKNNNQ